MSTADEEKNKNKQNVMRKKSIFNFFYARLAITARLVHKKQVRLLNM